MRSEQVGGAYCTYCCFSHLIESEADLSRSQDAFDMITNHFVTHGRSNARTLSPAEKEHKMIPLDAPWPWANSHFYLQYETSSSSPGHTKIQFSLIRSRVAHATLSQTIVEREKILWRPGVPPPLQTTTLEQIKFSYRSWILRLWFLHIQRLDHFHLSEERRCWMEQV